MTSAQHSSPPRDLLALLRQADAQLAKKEPSAAADQRILARLERPQSVSMGPLQAVVAAAAIALGVLTLREMDIDSQRATPSARAPAPSVLVAGFVPTSPSCALAQEGDDLIVLRPCTLRPVGTDATVQCKAGTRLFRTTRGVALRKGEIIVEVAPSGPDDAPFEVGVSEGVIQVIGTRFVVKQEEDGGFVALERGRIRFVAAADGQSRLMEPGDRKVWPEIEAAPPQSKPSALVEPVEPVEPVAEPAKEPGKPSRRAGVRTPEPVPVEELDEATVQRVQRLRRQGRYEEAVGVLERQLARRLEPRAAELLSYELGEILQQHLGRPEEACRHWRSHQSRYVRGLHGSAIEAMLRKLDCPK